MTDPSPNHDADYDRRVEAGGSPPAGTPRWVKVFGIVALAVVVLVVILMLMGGHGPGRHT